MRCYGWWFLFVCLFVVDIAEDFVGCLEDVRVFQYYDGMKYDVGTDGMSRVCMYVYLFVLPSLEEMSMFDVRCKMQICTYYMGTYMGTPHLNWEN